MDYNLTEEIKNEVDNYCNNLFNSRVEQYIVLPTVITIYLGEEVYHYANASLEDAFASSFTVGIQTCNYIMTNDGFSGEDLEETITNYLKDASQRRQIIGNIHVMFIGLMDAPFFDRDNRGIFSQLRETVDNLDDYGYGVRYSFYGIFRQDKIKENGIYHDYSKAFAFINQGKMIWRSIYHVEVKKIDPSFVSHSQMMAMNLIGEDYRMTQSPDSDEYCWKSLSLECLRLPEYILTRILNDIYSRQTSSAGVGQNEWDENIRHAMENYFQEFFNIPEFQCQRYVPLLYVPPVEQKKRRGFFHGGGTQGMMITEVFRDRDSMNQLAEQIYGRIDMSDKSYDEIIQMIVSSLYSVDADHMRIAQSVNATLNSMKNECERTAENIRSKNYVYDGSDILKYIDRCYDLSRKYAIERKKADIFEHLIQRISDGDILSKNINAIMDINRKICLSLDELSQRYGGSIQQISSSGLMAHSINEPVGQLLKSFNATEIKMRITDKRMILDRLERFLALSLGNSSYIESKHNLGGINARYSHLEPISSRILMTPDQYADKEIGKMMSSGYILEKVHNPLYRSNSFYILSSRYYCSDLYINRYRRSM